MSLFDGNDGISSYKVLARRYRPQFFRDVVGQDFFVTIIKNCIKTDRIGHSFLLEGIRGVGKTTLARLIAKALNCANLGPEIEPCGTCQSCTSIINDSHLDVVEIDAASNTGVDDMRSIIDSCGYMAVNGKYKVYIIDEVHMLSKSAFNSLLKTLEEPPAHVKFIFATTEVAKIPKTILSRCAVKLSLQRVHPKIIEDYLKKLCDAENIGYDDDSMQIIAKHADGSVRDSMSLLEQAILSSPSKKIETAIVTDLLGIAGNNEIYALLSNIIARREADAISLVRGIYQNGCDMRILIEQLMEAMHNIILAKHTKSTAPKGFDECDESNLYRLFQMAQKCMDDIRNASFPLLVVEMLVIRMIHISKFPTPDEILSKINNAVDYTENTAALSMKAMELFETE